MKPRLSMKLLWKYWGEFVQKNAKNGADHVGAHKFLSFVEKQMKQPQEN